MKRYILCLICGLLGLSLPLPATHIVGGEIQVKFVRAYNYDFTLNLYFDLINGNLEAKDRSIRISIFSKGSNIFMDSLRLPIVYEQQMQYTNPACSDASLRTLYMRYLGNMTLDPNRYTHQAGYYVIWERCCRNNVISNIEKPNDTGTTFYTEIPRIFTGQASNVFANSTPSFVIPKGDYLCADRPFSMDFSATDADGDELRYYLDNPLAGNSAPTDNSTIIPRPYPAPYKIVTWKAGYTAQTAIPHNPSLPANQLNIHSNTGLIKVTPSWNGLYVLSVRCEEWRNGVKIGEVRRDFQFKVITCPINRAPSINLQVGTNANGKAIYYKEGDVLTVTPDNLCFDVWAKDIDAPELLSFSARGVNFAVLTNFLTPTTATVQTAGDSAKSRFCWDRCLYSTKDNQGNWIPYIVDLIVSDDGCPANLKDTVRVKILYIPVANNPPTINSDAPTDASGQYDYAMTRLVGEKFEFNVFGNDIDNDLVVLSMRGVDCNPDELGMVFTSTSGNGSATGKFTWQNGCSGVTQQDNVFVLEFTVKESGTCESRERKIRVKLTLIDTDVDLTKFLPPNAFSPNGDNYNATFEMPNLPAENCRFNFQRITIYNRWGVKVFESTDRNFKWNGGEFPSATYFYTVDFKGTQYKGTVSLIK